MQTRYVDADSTAGGDGTTNALTGAARAYVSLAAWEAARQGTLTEIEEVVCGSNHTNHTADTAQCVIDGWTTSAAYNIQVRTDSMSLATAMWSESKYRLELDYYSSLLVINEAYCQVSNLQIHNTRSPRTDTVCLAIANIGTKTSNVLIDGCHLRQSGTGGDTSSMCLNIGSVVTAGVRNSIARGSYIGMSKAYEDQDLTFDNNTIYGCTFRGFSLGQPAGSLTMRNNLAIGNGVDYVFGIDGGTTSYTTNLSGDNTSPNSALRSKSVAFVNAAGGNFHLAASDTDAIDAGTDLSAYFTTDIDGETRPTGAGTWDIGADEYVATGQTYEVATALAVTTTFASTTTAAFLASISCAASAGVADGTTAAYPVALALAVTAALTHAAQGDYLAAVSLPGTAALTTDPVLAAQAAAVLAATGQLSPTVAAAFIAALSLPATGALAASLGTDVLAEAALAATGTVSAATTLLAQVSALLAGSALLTPTVLASLLASAPLAGNATLTPGAALLGFASAALAGNAALVTFFGNEVNAALSLSATAGLDLGAEAALAASLALDVTASLSVVTAQAAQALISLGVSASVATAVSAQLYAQLLLSAIAALQNGAGLNLIDPALIHLLVSALTSPGLTGVSLTSPSLIGISLTSPGLAGVSLEDAS